MKKTVLEQLSGDLPEREREELLLKIKQSITSMNVTDLEAPTEAHSEGERNILIREEMKNLSFFKKLMLWFFSRFSGKKKEDVFAHRKVQALKRIINHKAPGITGFETRNITPVLATEIFDIYRTILPVRRYFQSLWFKEGCFERIIVFLLNQRIQEPRESLEDFLSMEEMVLLYGQEGQRETIRSELLRRLKDYVDSIPAHEVLEAEEALGPFYFLKDMVLFPYASFFQLFRFNPIAMPDVEKPFFKNASAMLSLGYLEKLYIAGETARRVKEPVRVDPGLMEYLILLGEEDQEEDEDKPAEGEPELMKEERLKQHIRWIQDIHRKALKMSRNTPLLELLRFFHKDPYFVVVHETPELLFKEFYYLILKKLLLSRLEERFSEIRQRYIQGEIDALFVGKRLFVLQNYRDYSSIDYEKMGLPFFIHTKSVNLLYNYVHHFYREYFHEVVQLLDRNVLAQNRLTRDRLEKYASSFEDTEQRIREFDFPSPPTRTMENYFSV